MQRALESRLQELLIDIAQLDPDEAADIAERTIEALEEEGFFDEDVDEEDDN